MFSEQAGLVGGKEGITRKGKSPNDRMQGVGGMHSSDEVPVMGMERRRPAVMKRGVLEPKERLLIFYVRKEGKVKRLRDEKLARKEADGEEVQASFTDRQGLQAAEPAHSL